MIDNNNKFTPNWTSIFCITLVSWFVLVPIINNVHIPLDTNHTGVVSIASITNISPYTDYTKFLVLLLVPPLLVAIILNAKTQLIEEVLKKIFLIFQTKKVYEIIAVTLILLCVINTSYIEIGKLLIDSFHEGEYLGFLPNFLKLEKPFTKTFLVHGFGLDVLPSLLASKLTDSFHTITFTRFFVMIENIVSAVSCFWILWELTCSIDLKASNKVLIFLVIIFSISEGRFFYFDGGRGALFWIQLALTIRFFRTISANTVIKLEGFVIPLAVGMLLTASFLYNYDRAAYFILVYIFTSALAFCFGKKLFITWLGLSILGFTISLLLVVFVIGLEQVLEIIFQVVYWTRYGKYISFIPLPMFDVNSILSKFFLPIFVQSIVITYLVIDYKNISSFSLFLRKNYLTIILLFASIAYMRITLDRSDLIHAGWGAMATYFLAIYTILLLYKKYFESYVITLSSNPILVLCIIVFTTKIIIANPGFNLTQIPTKLQNTYESFSIPDLQLLKPDYREAFIKLKPEIEKPSCFFSLTSEGLWYYLFKKPSCSKYANIFYAKPTIAQELVVQDLMESKPEIVLIKNDMWSNSIDGIATTNSASIIYQYLLENYKPYLSISSHQFWKHRGNNLNVSTKERPTLESINTVLNENY